MKAATKLSPLEQRLRAGYNAAKTVNAHRRPCLICSGIVKAGEPIAWFKTKDLATHWACFNNEAMRARF